MTTLEAIGFTCVGGATVFVTTFAFFGIAVRNRTPNIAPRCTARHPDVIYNPHSRRPAAMSQNDKKGDVESNTGQFQERNSMTREEAQYRGGAMLGWIPWVLSLSYDTLLRGIPGTGTRKGGMEGSLLKVNLDAIVLFRFHAICLRVAVLATVLCIGILLPLNYTARCYNETAAEECLVNHLTNYEQTTIQNIPTLPISTKAVIDGIFGSSRKIYGTTSFSIMARLYAVVFVSWGIMFYAIRLLDKEWIDLLAFRRVYYLESHHFENRMSELEETLLYSNTESSDSELEDENSDTALKKRRMTNTYRDESYMKRRDPWIPHPEQRETVPNIELYSVLVGGLPSLRSEVLDEDDLETSNENSKRTVDWQLLVTTRFFDKCVPNQPGFSSSVAAVTILPDATELATAWRKWYRHAALFRKLCFIQSLIKEYLHYDIDDSDDEVASQKKTIDVPGNSNIGSIEDLNLVLEQKTIMDKEVQNCVDYYRDVLGNFPSDSDDPSKILSPINMFGPEQTAVYSREFAQGAAACCPNGCGEQRFRTLGIDELKEIERETKELCESSLEDWKNARKHAAVNRDDDRSESKSSQSPRKYNVTSNLDFDDLTSQNNITTEAKIAPKYNGNTLKLDDEGKTKYSREMSFDSDATIPTANHYTVADSRTGPVFPQGRGGNQIQNNLSAPPRPTKKSILTPTKPANPTFSRSSQSFTHTGSASQFSKPSSSDASLIEGRQSLKLANYSHISHEEKSFVEQSEPPITPQQNHNQEYLSDVNLAPNSIDLLDHIPNYDIVHPSVTTPSVASVPTRRRFNTDFSVISSREGRNHEDNGNKRWFNVERIVKHEKKRHVFTGVWKWQSPRELFKSIFTKVNIKNLQSTATKAVEDVRRDSTFAVITFTSRQAAVAARHCLLDGSGRMNWQSVDDIPVPPLADAAVCDFVTCRGCCRPVTLTINPNQQLIRKYLTLMLLACVFVFYTVPITSAAALVAPEKLQAIWPGLEELTHKSIFLSQLLSGLVPAMLFTLFFALCPVMFRAISNFGSNAVSVNNAEYTALQYYWWFMLFTAFSGTSLATMALNAINQGQLDNNGFTDILREIAGTLPNQVSATWLNWIIFRTTMTLPLQYMLQVNTFIFQCLGWRCCRRCVMGGGPGGPIPYRIYIDSGVVFLCTVALAPVSPLVAPAAMFYFLYCSPLWRRNCIFIYRPKFDTGGRRWPFLSDVCITSMFVAQLLLTTLMVLKEAIGPAIFAALPMIPTYLHRKKTRELYHKSYKDAALLNTALLDGWDNRTPMSMEKREGYRKFLVDAHRAAYIPICIAGSSTDTLTAEPAVVIPLPHDIDAYTSEPYTPVTDMNNIEENDSFQESLLHSRSDINATQSPHALPTPPPYRNLARLQHGASLRRLTSTKFSLSPNTIEEFSNV